MWVRGGGGIERVRAASRLCGILGVVSIRGGGCTVGGVEGGGGGFLETFIAAFCVDPILKRIPKGARIMASSVLENVLTRVTDGPDDLSAWNRLFSFPHCLVKPLMGGVRRNLTSSILARLRKLMKA